MKKHEILLVDDDQSILKTFSIFLRGLGYIVTPASSGKEAIELLEKGKFDLLITDLVMKPLNGIDVLKKSKEINHDLMVIILTAHGDMKSAIDAVRYGADDYLLKPSEKEEIQLRVANLLEKLEYKRKVKLYEKVLPICCVCKKIRDDKGAEPGKGKWVAIEEYIHKSVGLLPSHGYCPCCYEDAAEKVAKYISKN